MRTRTIAALDLALLFPAVLFMAALVVRGLGQVEFEPAHSAQQLIAWYAGRMWTLWVLLLALPFTVALSGCVALLSRSNGDPEFGPARRMLTSVRSDPASLLIAATTLAAGGILTIVVLHMAAN